ncbi:methyl-accepting chemotaxis protein [Hoeflea prorocentri]|uniref:Methyl-accepting chemotaxis protein n=1 Tax=Hoeflea prorocentri TaxID=1922333 RepID=A0A9X3ZJM0_9HYPH|nr:methyl-accepting chemotaxis protein [Hoeflea prorocentri]MCY6383233.1 methyl-accepting chemotaxis protein [Hoeflea prorocentri]MDA5401033.1 methyl-accepting chemotaxis protein [Hoeflea prorocentri]
MLRSLSIGKKFAFAFGALITLFLLISGYSLYSFTQLKNADEWNSHTYEVLDHSGSLIAAIVNQESGVRGFLVSGDEKFLGPYISGEKTFETELNTLLTLTSDNASQQERLRRIQAGAEKWHRDVIDQEIALGKNPDTLNEARAIAASGAGKAIMDSIRAAHAEFEEAERSLLVTRSATKDETMLIATIALVAGSLVILFVASAMGWFLNRNIGGAVSDMTVAMGELASGNNSVEIPHAHRQDELGAMAAAVQVFKDNALRNEELVKEQEAQKEQAEAERRRAQEEAIQSERAMVVESFGTALSAIANKDLSSRITDDLPAAYEELKSDFNKSIANLEEALVQVGYSAESIKGGTHEIRSASDQLSRRAEQQAASVEETAAAVDEITATVKTTAERAGEAGSLVVKTQQAATESGEVVQDAISAMGEIKESSDQIASIIGVIDDIAFQTNLLALNAGVEAARAGDAGKGFAVVAQEVRELAQRSGTAANEIKELITKSGVQVQNGVELVDRTGSALQTILASVTEVADHVRAIAQASQEQSSGLQEINSAINSIDQGTQQSASMVEETNASSHTLNSEVGSLTGLLDSFQTSSEPRRKPISTAAPEVREVKKTNVSSFPIDGNAALDTDNWSEF